MAEAHRDRLTPQRLRGPADLVVELISPDSVSRDPHAKFDEAQSAGIPEYWLVDVRPGHEQSDFYQLIDGTYQAIAIQADGRYHSAVIPGFWLRPEWMWQEPLPGALRCLVEIAPDILSSQRFEPPRSRPISGQ